MARKKPEGQAQEGSQVAAQVVEKITRKKPAGKTIAKKPVAASKAPVKKPAPAKTKAPAKKAPAKKDGPRVTTPAPKGKAIPIVPLKAGQRGRKPKAVPIEQLPDDDVAIAEANDPLCGLTAQEASFVDIYLTTYNQADAYIAAGFKVTNKNSAAACASRLLNSAKAAKYRAKRMKDLMARNEEAQDRLLNLYVDMAYADSRELSELHVDACRFCYGVDHLYQFTPNEYDRHVNSHEKACREAEEAGMEPPDFDPKGGIGYNPNVEPNSDCPECFGRGRERPVFKDTRLLSPAGQRLFAGVKEGKDGLEVKTHDQMKARETLAKIYKLFDESSTVVVNVNAEELEAIFGEKMRKSHDRMAEMREQRRKDGEG